MTINTNRRRGLRGLGDAGTIQGAMDWVGCDNITGWLWDSSQPNKSIDVTVLGDGAQLWSGQASIVRSLPTGDNGAHSFSVPVPPGWHDGQPHTIKAFDSQYNVVLQPQPQDNGIVVCPAPTVATTVTPVVASGSTEVLPVTGTTVSTVSTPGTVVASTPVASTILGIDSTTFIIGTVAALGVVMLLRK